MRLKQWKLMLRSCKLKKLFLNCAKQNFFFNKIRTVIYKKWISPLFFKIWVLTHLRHCQDKTVLQLFLLVWTILSNIFGFSVELYAVNNISPFLSHDVSFQQWFCFLISDIWRSSPWSITRLGQWVAFQTETVAHAQHQRSRTIYSYAAVALRQPKHRKTAGSEDGKARAEQTTPRLWPGQQQRHFFERHLRVLQQ